MSAVLEHDADELARLTAALRAHGADAAEWGLVLGSGIAAFVDATDSLVLPQDELPGCPVSTVPGHAGRLLLGSVAGRRVLVQQGRVHLYEGRHPLEVTRVVRAMAALGIGRLVLTNAAGALGDHAPGTLMRIEDHLNLQGVGALPRVGAVRGRVYDPELGAALDRTAERLGIPLVRGVYAGLGGPSYETPAEIRALGRLGADAVGMSTVQEAQAGAAAGLAVLGLSCLTNPAAGIGTGPLDHEDVLAAGRSASRQLAELLRSLVESAPDPRRAPDGDRTG